ncbi:MAG: sulfite exporter TauE/SafE family protein [Bacteroidota bacterium]
MDAASQILFYFLTFLIEIIGTVGGFGSSVFFVPMANYFFEFHQVLGVTSLLHVFSNLSKIYLFRKGVDYKIFLKIGVPSFIFVVVGAYFSRFLTTYYANLILGIFLILFAGFLLLRPSFSFKPTTSNSVLGGSVAGWLAGWLGTGGAVRGLTLASFNIGKESFLATSALIDFVVDSSRFGVYAFQGYLTKEMLFLAPILLIISFIGSYIGKLLLNKISQETFKKIALWLILLVGVYSFGYYFYNRN